jgi:hypothetical protein
VEESIQSHLNLHHELFRLSFNHVYYRLLDMGCGIFIQGWGNTRQAGELDAGQPS